MLSVCMVHLSLVFVFGLALLMTVSYLVPYHLMAVPVVHRPSMISIVTLMPCKSVIFFS